MYLSPNCNCKTRVLKAMHHQNKKLKKCTLSDPANCSTMADEKSDKSEVQSHIDVPNETGILGSCSNDSDSGTKEPRNPPLIPILANHEQWQKQSQQQNPQPGFDLKDLLERMPVPTFSLTNPPLTMPFWIPQHPGPVAGAPLPALFPSISPEKAAEIAKKTGMPCSQQQHSPSLYNVEFPFPSLSPGLGDPRPSKSNAMPPPSSPSFEGLLGGCRSASTSSIQKDSASAPTGIPLEHQQLREAQSLQNTQLWKIVGELQSELAEYKRQSLQNTQLWKIVGELQSEQAEYKRRIIMLETDFETLKTVVGGKTAEKFASGDSTLRNEKRSNPHQAQPEMMKRLNYEKVFLKRVDYDIPILHKPDAQTTKKSKKGKGSGGDVYLEKLLVPKSEETTIDASKRVCGIGTISSSTTPSVSHTSTIGSHKVDAFGTISSSKAPLNLLVKIEQQEM